MRRNHVGLFFILVTSLLVVSIPQAASPPLSYGYTCGLISALEPDIRISRAKVNTSITPHYTNGENLTHRIEVYSSYNITSTADHEVGFLTSYVRSSLTPEIILTNNPQNVTIEGNSLLYNASIDYNNSNRTSLPVGLASRFPSGFFSSFMDSRIDVVNLTIAAHAAIVLSLQTIFVVRCYGNYFDFRYGLDMQKLEDDSTHLDAGLDVSNISLLVRTDFLNSRSRSVTQVDDMLLARWSITDWDWGGETTYPGLQLDYDVFSDYIGVQLWQSEYFPPTMNPGSDILGPPLFIMMTVTALVIFFVTIFRLKK